MATPFLEAVIMKALDGLAARAAASAQNIANANTARYRPVRVSFEAALAEAARSGDLARVGAVQPRLELARGEGVDGDLRVDTELTTAAATALRYGALVDLLNRQIQIDGLAVKGSL